jgi:hypothetical protein
MVTSRVANTRLLVVVAPRAVKTCGSSADRRTLIIAESGTKYAPTHHRLRPNVRSDVSPAAFRARREPRVHNLTGSPRTRLAASLLACSHAATPHAAREMPRHGSASCVTDLVASLPADPGCPRPPDPTTRTCRANPIPIRRGAFLGARRFAPAPIRASPARTDGEGR